MYCQSLPYQYVPLIRPTTACLCGSDQLFKSQIWPMDLRLLTPDLGDKLLDVAAGDDGSVSAKTAQADHFPSLCLSVSILKMKSMRPASFVTCFEIDRGNLLPRSQSQ